VLRRSSDSSTPVPAHEWRRSKRSYGLSLKILFDVFFKDRPAADPTAYNEQDLHQWDIEDTADHAERLAAASRKCAA
jgi:hypothetical protein